MESFSYSGRDLEAMSFAKNYYQWILDEFRPFLGPRVAEIGAGCGSFSSLLITCGIKELVAVEPSKEMFSRLKERFAEESRIVSYQAFFEKIHKHYSQYFDTIFYVNVLEHIKDDAQELLYAQSCLKKNGSLCIFVPANPWLYSAFDQSLGHYRRYTKDGLTKLIEDAGFKIAVIRYFDSAGIIPWLVLFTLLGGKNLTKKAVALYDTFAVPFLKQIEMRVSMPIGKNLLAVGIKSY